MFPEAPLKIHASRWITVIYISPRNAALHKLVSLSSFKARGKGGFPGRAARERGAKEGEERRGCFYRRTRGRRPSLYTLYPLLGTLDNSVSFVPAAPGVRWIHLYCFIWVFCVCFGGGGGARVKDGFSADITREGRHWVGGILRVS